MDFPSLPHSPGVFNNLATGLGLPVNPIVKGQWFKDQVMRLDGWQFQNCRFDGCKLHVATASISLDRCYIDEQTMIIFEGAVLNIVRLFHVRNNYMKDQFPFFAPTYHADGTISIGGA